MSHLVTLVRTGRCGLITLASPPVNALSQAVRSGLVEALARRPEWPAGGVGPAAVRRALLFRRRRYQGVRQDAAGAPVAVRDLGIADDDPRVNPNGGAIALGHPLGMSGARLLLTAAHELQNSSKRYALCTMCVGVRQGTATLLEREDI